MGQEQKMLKSAGTIGLATSLSRIFGFFRDMTFALVLGAGFSMDAFTIAFRLANLFRRLVGEGGVSAAFIPVFVGIQSKESPEKLWEFARKFFYTLAIVTGAAVALEIAFAPWLIKLMAPGFNASPGKWELTVLLTRLMAPYLLCISLAALLMGILNSCGHFLIPALSPVFFNLSIIASGFFLVQYHEQPAVALAYGVLIGGVLQFVVQIPVAIAKGMRFQPGFSFQHPAIQKVSKLIAPSVFGIGVVQLNLFIDALMASWLREGSVSHLYYSDRIMELVLGVFVISLATVILPDMSKSAASNDIKRMKSTLLFSFRTAAFVAVPATVGLIMFARLITHVLFERGEFTSVDSERTAVALIYYAAGLCFIAGTRLIVPAFYAMQDTKTPVKVGVIALVANAILNYLLMKPLEQGGIALATSLASLLSFVLLVFTFEKKHGGLEWGKFFVSFGKIALASAAMGTASLLFFELIQFSFSDLLIWKIVKLFGTISIGVLVYFITALLLRSYELNFIRSSALFAKKKK